MSFPATTDEPRVPPSTAAPRLIVGMSRAATTWLCKCLNEHPDVVAFGESLFWGRGYVTPHHAGRYDPAQVDDIRRRLRTGSCLEAVLGDGRGCLSNLDRARFGPLLDESFASLPTRPAPAEVFTALLEAVARGEGKSMAVEKTPHHLNWIDRILAAMPDARLVMMVREPYSFMLSYKHQGDRMEERVRRQFRRRYHPAGCAIVWRGAIRAALEAQRSCPRQVLLVEFSDVQDDPARVLDGVQRFFGLSPVALAARVPADNTSFPDQPRPALRGEDVFWMNRVAGRTIGAAGWSRRPAPREPLRILVSILRLPFWGLWNLFSLRRIVRGSILAYLWRWYRPVTARPKETHG
ncbi:MAG: sulfotransferase family protein [Planctomycetota bacterium]|jgi:hypothetical protein